ncbi:microcephalin isoform X2 [Bacillus rossius redtenbacheri]|uniref:microcephalin isoform X2 n=1 Tax=Bacillus rossius redtenbacheri TaxID=93214 RepID=UPI002FDD980A
MALQGNLSKSDHFTKTGYVTRRPRKSRASRSLAHHFHDESGAQSNGVRVSSRLKNIQEDALTESLVCEVGDGSDDSRGISYLEQSIDVSSLNDLSDFSKKKQTDNAEVTRANDTARRSKVFEKQHHHITADISSDGVSSDDTASLNSFECVVSDKVGLATKGHKNKSSCKSKKSLNSTDGIYHQDDSTTKTDRNRLSSASHNATRGSFGSPQLVEESPDVEMFGMAAKGHNFSRSKIKEPVSEATVSVNGGMRSLLEHKSPTLLHSVREVLQPDENVTPRIRREIGIFSADRTQGRELFTKLLEAARETLSRSARKASSCMSRNTPAIDGITKLASTTPTSQHRRVLENIDTPTNQLSAAKAHISIRTVPVTPKTPKSVHFRDFPRSPSLSKMSLQRSVIISPATTVCENSFRTSEHQSCPPDRALSTTPVNRKMQLSGDKVPARDVESPIPDTQPVSAVLLKDVVAYVEVRSNGEDRSAGVKSHLQELGATVVDRLNKRVTHVLFKEGLLSTYNKAMKWHIPLVTVQWIEECKKRECVVSERLFLPSNMDVYQSPDPLRKIKRVKHLHTDEDDGQKLRKARQKRLEKLKMVQVETDASTETDTDSVVGNVVDQNRDKDANHESRLLHTLQKLVESNNGSCLLGKSSSPTSDDETCVPLAVRLLRQMQNSNTTRRESIDIGESSGDKPTDGIRNPFKKFESSEGNEGNENMSPRKSSHSNKKLCSPSEKHSVSKQHEQEGSVSGHKCNDVQLPIVPLKKSLKLNKTIDPPIDKDILANINSTLDCSSMSNSSRGKGHKRKLMPLSQSSSPTVVDTTLINGDLSHCFSPASKKRRMCSRISEEMELTRCVSASNEAHDAEEAGTSAAEPSRTGHRRGTRALKKGQGRLTRRSVALPSPSRSPQLVVTRRSSGVFIKVKTKQERLSRTFPTLVLTSFPKDSSTGLGRDVEMLAACVVRLGGFQPEARVSSRTTHVVSNGPRRTLNVLRAIARGCWVLSQDWVLNSLEAGKWLPEEQFEIRDFSPAVTSRVERECLGPGFKLDLFRPCGPMLIAKQSKPPPEDLKELVRLCGGKLAGSVKDADIAVGLRARDQRITCVSEKWLLDSITQLSVQPTSLYVLDRRQSNCVR